MTYMESLLERVVKKLATPEYLEWIFEGYTKPPFVEGNCLIIPMFDDDQGFHIPTSALMVGDTWITVRSQNRYKEFTSDEDEAALDFLVSGWKW